MKALITHKIGMTSTIGKDGVVEAITLLSVEPNVITQVKSIEKDGYNAVQIGSGNAKKLAKPLTGHFKLSGIMPKIAKEVRLPNEPEDLAVATKLTAEVFSVGDLVDVTADSKGKGFAGTIKRHNFKRGRKTHGGRSYRRPGSIGSMYPQKIFKGKKMAGQMGGTKTTVKKLKIAIVDVEKSIIGVTGAVPGPRKAVVFVRETK
jgi:large subunit ribosomal protein L3